MSVEMIILDQKLQIDDAQNIYVIYKRVFKSIADLQTVRLKALITKDCKTLEEGRQKALAISETIFEECVRRCHHMLHEFQIYDISFNKMHDYLKGYPSYWGEVLLNAQSYEELIEALGEALRKKCNELHRVLMTILVEKKKMSRFPYGSEEDLINSLGCLEKLQSNLEEEDFKVFFIQGIESNPFLKNLYLKALERFGIRKDLYDLAEYFGVDIRDEIKKEVMLKISQLPTETKEEIEYLLKTLKNEARHYPRVNLDKEVRDYEDRRLALEDLKNEQNFKKVRWYKSLFKKKKDDYIM